VTAPAQVIVILAALLVCAGSLAAIVTSPNREQQPSGEVFGWAVLLATVFAVLAVAGVHYVAPQLAPLLTR
jgi:hypothetical protein